MRPLPSLILATLLMVTLTSCGTRPDTIYYGTFHTREFKAVPMAGGQPTTLSQGFIIDALAYDRKSEKVVVGSNSGRGSIFTRSLDGNRGKTLLNGTLCEKMDIDPKRNHLYWVENTKGQAGRCTIKRCDLGDGGNIITVPIPEMVYIDDLAVDPRRKKLYWSAGPGPKRMWWANLDGSEAEQIGSVTTIEHIAVDYRRARLYFTKKLFENRGIYVSDLDGSGARLLIPAKVYRYDDLVVDPFSGCIFWSEREEGALPKIWSARPDGSDQTLVLEEARELAYIKAIALGRQHRSPEEGGK